MSNFSGPFGARRSWWTRVSDLCALYFSKRLTSTIDGVACLLCLRHGYGCRTFVLQSTACQGKSSTSRCAHLWSAQCVILKAKCAFEFTRKIDVVYLVWLRLSSLLTGCGGSSPEDA